MSTHAESMRSEPMAPHVERLTARLAQAPAVFFAPVDPSADGSVNLEAVVADLFRDRASRAAAAVEVSEFGFAMRLTAAQHAERRAQGALVLIACWLLHDDAFSGVDADRLHKLLAKRLGPMSKLVMPRAFVEDPERREELVRVCLDALGLAPAGEARAVAEDRLASVDTVRRTRLLAEARKREQEREAAREKRKAEIAEKLRKQQEEAAREAARTTHED